MQDGNALPLSTPRPDPVGVGLPQFYIPATASLQERRPRTLKHGDTFAVFDHNGDILSGAGSPEGLFHRDTRHLSHLDLTLGGVRPMLLSSTLRDDNAVLTCDLTNPDLFQGERMVLERDLIHIRRSKFLWDRCCYERLAIRNFSDQRQRLRLELRFAADFADLFEVRGAVRPQRGALHVAEIGADTVLLAYTGLDGARRATRLRFDPAPASLTADTAVFDLDLPRRRRCSVHVEVTCTEEAPQQPVRKAFMLAIRDARRALRRSSSRAASVATSNEIFNEAVRRSVADLYMLMTDKAGGPYPYAGIPWFSTAFGRDAIITAYLMLWMDPEVARGVLWYLAEHQAMAEDPAADAEPGKILHEVRAGEMAELGEVPFRRYYGSVDSTPLFVMLAGAYLERTGDLATVRALWPNIAAALAWIDHYGDRDGDGFVEYGRKTEEGLANQGWKDSHDSIFHADGGLATGPIALCEVQGYVYAAKRAAAAIAAHLGDLERQGTLEREAETLRERFENAFWCEDLGTYALALDGEKRACRVRSSNAGHALFCGIAAPERAERVARHLMDTPSFSGWGVRTIANTEARYNPMSYHNGSVWPHDNALIALGLSRYGHKDAVTRLFEGLFAASEYMDLRRLPELFCGFPRRRGNGPTAYPVACSPQAWAAATPLALLQASLGLGFDPWQGRVRLDRPYLPGFLDEVCLRQVQLNGASIDLLIRRYGNQVVASVPVRTGDVSVVTIS
ncbi:amylo-alpha-1,6-glucosidase [Azospirillum rugosum]|uniref:Glycogen debranching enzyme n=1 Tax=Azospirillum rugosum TaxID=416170 RepID=A0ABS4SSH3_9PROT|nr:amylo-alpha-1,6-glucosidase [Azospirillum rugosum]MBP2294340.1 glycogen debranching enzyme [Azospirillum rugosum]MDQ0527675.1 glycogen debranching enzyme [Azospirillum rugosum]